MTFRAITLADARNNPNNKSARYYVLTGKNGDDNRYDLLGYYTNGYFTFGKNFIENQHGKFLFVDEDESTSGGKRSTRRQRR